MSGTEKKSRFGFDGVAVEATEASSRRRGGGPMSAAVRETAENLKGSTEAKVEARKRNADDAKIYRAARDEGRIVEKISIDEVRTDDLPRDRIDLSSVGSSDEMDELKASIRAHGQKEPIELFLDEQGALQLKKGWRRLSALRALYDETSDDRFHLALARIDRMGAGRLQHYVDMVEENVIREDLTFAEMAQLAISASCDPRIEGSDAEGLVNSLYASLHKMKRSYIRSFVGLLQSLGEDLRFPKAVPRNLGVDVMRRLREEPDSLAGLRDRLRLCADVEGQGRVLEAFVSLASSAGPMPERQRGRSTKKYEFRVEDLKVTARHGELRLKSDADYTDIPQERLELAIEAFLRVVREAN